MISSLTGRANNNCYIESNYRAQLNVAPVISLPAAEAPPDSGAHEDTERGRYTLKGKKLHLQ